MLLELAIFLQVVALDTGDNQGVVVTNAPTAVELRFKPGCADKDLMNVRRGESVALGTSSHGMDPRSRI